MMNEKFLVDIANSRNNTQVLLLAIVHGPISIVPVFFYFLC